MKRAKKYSIPLSSGNILDVKIEIGKGYIKGFVLNLRCLIDDLWYQIYRVDTAHGYLHEQRFWISPEPVPLIQHTSLDYAFEFYMRQIRDSFERYRKYYTDKMNKR